MRSLKSQKSMKKHNKKTIKKREEKREENNLGGGLFNNNENNNGNGNGYRNDNNNDNNNDNDNNNNNDNDNEDDEDSWEKNELYELEDEITMQLASLNIDENYDEEETICDSNTMHNLEENLLELNDKICNIEDTVKELIQMKAREVYTNFLSENHNIDYVPAETTQWLENFRGIYEFQRFSENDIKQGVQYMLPSYDPDNEYLIDLVDDSEYCIKRLFSEYRFKIITSYFTKASITYATYLFNPNTWNRSTYEYVDEINYGPISYHYLNNLFCILSLANEGINTTLNYNWDYYVSELECNNSSYIHSGGNIFVLLAGMLCYIKNRQRNSNYTKMNRIVEKLYQRIGEESFSGFTQYLDELFQEDNFQYSLKTIMSGLSDMDFLFMSSNTEIFQHEDNSSDTHASDVNALSASILRSMLYDTLEGKSSYNALFPFMEGYTSDQGRCKMFNGSNITHENMDKINENGLINQYYGFRQTSSYINEINIYLNRIKQAYLPLDEDCIDDYNAYIKKYGECIDLVIGSTNNEIFNHKYELFQQGHIYSIKALYSELEIIKDNTLDDKSDKRLQRMYFLRRFIDSPFYYTFNHLLVLCYQELHTDKHNQLIGFPCPNGYNQYQSLKWAKENTLDIELDDTNNNNE